MWSFILPLVGKLPGFIEAVVLWLTKRSNTAQTVAQVQPLIQEQDAKRALPVGWMVQAAFGLSLIHYGAICIDSTFRRGWQIAKLPAPYEGLELFIIISVVGAALVVPAVRRITKK